MQFARAGTGGQPERDAKRLAPRTARAQPAGGRPSDAPLELGLACVERVAERRVPRELVAGNRVQLEQPPQERLRVLAREVAALDECDGVREICERQPASETRAVGALGRIGRRHELARSAAAQPPAPSQLLRLRHDGDTRGIASRGFSRSLAVSDDLQGNTCSCRTYVPMIACLVIPGFELRAALRPRPGLALQPAALSPRRGDGAAARAGHGRRRGARRAAGDADGGGARDVPAARARRAGPVGARSRSGRESCAGSRTPGSPSTRRSRARLFETRGVERLYGGLQPSARAGARGGRRDVGPARGRGRAPVRGARGGERRAAGASARRRRRAHGASSSRRSRSTCCRCRRGAAASCRSWACSASASLRRCRAAPSPSGSGRTGRQAWQLARGGRRGRVRGRRPPAEIVETLEFPEAVGERAHAPPRARDARRAGARRGRTGRGGSSARWPSRRSSSAAARGGGR